MPVPDSVPLAAPWPPGLLRVMVTVSIAPAEPSVIVAFTNGLAVCSSLTAVLDPTPLTEGSWPAG